MAENNGESRVAFNRTLDGVLNPNGAKNETQTSELSERPVKHIPHEPFVPLGNNGASLGVIGKQLGQVVDKAQRLFVPDDPTKR